MKDLQIFLDSKHTGIHNFCYGVVNSYYQPVEYKIINNCSFEILSRYGKNRRKLFLFGEPETITQEVCYSSCVGSEKKTEISHNLSDVFNKDNYNRKKRYNTIIRPFNWSSKNNLVIDQLDKNHLFMVEQLHDKWVDLKLNDPKTFKIMFPTKRYIKCFYHSLENKNYISFGAFLEGQLVSVRVLYLVEEWAYDLAFFTDYSQHNFLTGFVDILILDKLKGLGVNYLNRGVELNKGLKQYKTQYPHFEVNYYQTKPDIQQASNNQLQLF